MTQFSYFVLWSQCCEVMVQYWILNSYFFGGGIKCRKLQFCSSKVITLEEPYCVINHMPGLHYSILKHIFPPICPFQPIFSISYKFRSQHRYSGGLRGEIKLSNLNPYLWQASRYFQICSFFIIESIYAFPPSCITF